MKTKSTCIELLSALQITCIRLFVLGTLRVIRTCALHVIVVPMRIVYGCFSTPTGARRQIVQPYKLAVFRRGVRASY